MKTNFQFGFIASCVLIFCCCVLAADPATGLKDTFKDDFLVGVAINRSHATGTAGFRRPQEATDKEIDLVKQHFNQITAENDMKWQLIHPRPGPDGYDFEPADAMVSFGEEHGMYLVGHTLVWHSQTPNWVFEGNHLPDGTRVEKNSAAAESPAGDVAAPPPAAAESGPGQGPQGRRGFGPGGGRGRGFGGFRGFNLDGPRATREELLERMRDHIHTVVGRYKGKVKVWDVVNEAIADGGDEILRRSPWSAIIGEDFIAKAFEYAHEADPDAILRYNDYGLENPQKRAKLIKLVKSLQEQKVPIHAIGTQAHCNVSITYETVNQALTEMAELGLPIHVTELDVNTAAGGQRGTGANVSDNAQATQGGQVAESEKRLADAYAGLFKAFLEHKGTVTMVTFWGVNDAVSWRRQGSPLLFDGDSEPKAAFDAVLKVADELHAASAQP